jgi:hypothetical protein
MARECTKQRRRTCFYCGKEGHLIEKCYAKSRDEANAKPVKDLALRLRGKVRCFFMRRFLKIKKSI